MLSTSQAQQTSGVRELIDRLERPVEIAWEPERASARGIYGFNSMDPRSRSFNLIRGKLVEYHRSRDWRLLGVVSATPNVGKSFVTANLSASVSRDPMIGTFAIDLDLRRGSLTEQFGLAPEEGLSEHLGRGAPLTTLRLAGEKLSLVPTVGKMLHSAELLASQRAALLFEAMRSSDPRNLFICDLPPVFANDDAVTAMAHLDAYVLVAEEGRTTEREIRDAVDVLGRERLAGIVLNKFRGGMVSDGYGIDSYYAAGYEGNVGSR